MGRLHSGIKKGERALLRRPKSDGVNCPQDPVIRRLGPQLRATAHQPSKSALMILSQFLEVVPAETGCAPTARERFFAFRMLPTYSPYGAWISHYSTATGIKPLRGMDFYY